MTVRAAEFDDLEPIARIHKDRFSQVDYPLGQLSRSLIAAFYARYLTGAVFLVHTNESGAVDAFVMGGEADLLSARKREFIRSSALRIAWETLLRPRLWSIGACTAWRTLLPSARPPMKNIDRTLTKNTRLLSIAVAQNAMGTGAATALVEAFDEQLRHRCVGYELTVLKSNQRARRFYEKLNFSLVGETKRECVLRKMLDDRPEG